MARTPRTTVFLMTDMIACRPRRINSRILLPGSDSSSPVLTLFAMAAGESISTETSPYGKLATVLEGSLTIAVEEKSHVLGTGASFIISTGQAHAFRTDEDCIYTILSFHEVHEEGE